ncbi:GAF domain-containing protein [Nitrospina watsonii]|uniref:histidine kinase n=1 Tax=Nitrospina watsonii TaxID=1323948 RepID=A0ABM9HEZ3_9BACT|nr:GAF domain-containing protein [Nitrospina watsonii]CAI2718716.1 Putative Histidine kinase [Nitrospina watsonii]
MVEDSIVGLEVLREIARISTSPLNLDQILAQTIAVIKNKMRVDACSIYLVEQGYWEELRLKLKASSGLPSTEAARIYLEPGRGVTGWVAQNKTTLALSEAMQDPRFVYFPEIEEEKFPSMLSVPLLDHDQCIGVINVHTLDRRQFTAMETSILETISAQITGCIRNALEFQKSQSLLREQTLLYTINTNVQATPKLDHRIWILMTGITFGGAGGFNRAILFLLDEKHGELSGHMGLGPDSPGEAGRIWSELARDGEFTLNRLLENPEWERFRDTRFNQFARSLKIPLQPGHVLADTALQKKPCIIQDAFQDPAVPRQFVNALGTPTFATVPLMPHQEVLGVLLVDNLYNSAPITEANLQLAGRLATHLGWVIENSRLVNKLLESNRELLSTKEQLIQSEKLAALGELSAEVAHEIKNPLVSVGGFARRLRDHIGDLQKKDTGSPPPASDLRGLFRYANIIVNETERLERLLQDILLFSKAEELEVEACPINELVKEVLDFFEVGIEEKDIRVDKNLMEKDCELYLDKKKIKQVIMNLLFNAIESMPQQGRLNVSTYRSPLKGSVNTEKEAFTLCIEDTGGGIPQELFENIFNPFFTTKESGTGLGLSISRRIIEGHGGTLYINNNVNKGVTVYVYLPLQNIGNYNKT